MKWIIAILLAMASPPKAIGPKSDVYLESGGMAISKRGYDLIMEFEVGGGEVYYNRYLIHPEWPGESSGVTVGIGYDLGYNSTAQIEKDWGDKLSQATVNRLKSCSGLTGTRGKLKLGSVRDIVIPWSVALEVYKQRTIPRFANLTRGAYSGVDTLHPHVQGAMLSWVFNRGEGITSKPRDLEKRQMRDAIPTRPQDLPRYFRSSQRLWPNTPGLTRRRRAEAALVESSLPP